MNITIARDLAVGGRHIDAGTVLTIGPDIADKDAKTLLEMGANTATEGGEKTAKRGRADKTAAAGDKTAGESGGNAGNDNGAGQ
jgi:hypothetical protein